MPNYIQNQKSIRYWIKRYTGNFIKKDVVQEALENAGNSDNNKKR